MSRIFLLYLLSLTVRSLIVAASAGFLTSRIRGVALRHAVWTTVLAVMLAMPVADALLPERSVPPAVQQVVLPVQTFIVLMESPPEPMPVAPTPPVASEPTRDWWFIGALGAVGIGALLLSRFALAYNKVRKMRRESVRIEGLASGADIRESPAAVVPLTVGLFRPAVILPPEWRRWEEWKLRAVLCHEMTHVRRRDWAVAASASFAKCVFWFNPLAWWLERRLSSLCEEASDEASVLSMGDAPRYAEALLQLASQAQGHRLLGGVPMARHRIRSRIERVLSVSRPGNGLVSRSGWLALAALALPAVFLAAAVGAATLEAQEELAVFPAEALQSLRQAPAIPANPPEPESPATPVAPPAPQTAVPAPAAPQPEPAPQSPPVFDRYREGIFRYWAGWVSQQAPAAPETPPNAFAFTLTGVAERTLSFSNDRGGAFSFGCRDCTFTVWESGVGESGSSSGPGISFKLSADGTSVEVTCLASECSMRSLPGFGGIDYRSWYGGPVIGNKTYFFRPGDGDGTPASYTLSSNETVSIHLSDAPRLRLRPIPAEGAAEPAQPDPAPQDGRRVCFSVFGNVKADGIPFTAERVVGSHGWDLGRASADCPGGIAVSYGMPHFTVTR